jgi:four helix bundle protein
MINNFEKLNVLKEAHKFVLLVYNYSGDFPRSEIFALTSQLRRAAVSVPSNIVEGNSRSHIKEYVQFLFVAIGSLEEAKYQILLARDLEYISLEKYEELQIQAEHVGKLLSGLVKYLKSK